MKATPGNGERYERSGDREYQGAVAGAHLGKPFGSAAAAGGTDHFPTTRTVKLFLTISGLGLDAPADAGAGANSAVGR